jgi:hypothetical protein
VFRILSSNLNLIYNKFLQLRSYLEEKVATLVYEAVNTAVGIRHADNVALSIRKSWH